MKKPSQWDDPARVEKLLSLARDGLPYKLIGEHLGTSESCVKGKLQAMGIKKADWFKPSPAAERLKPVREFPVKARHELNLWEARNRTNITIRKFSWESQAHEVD